MPVYTVSKYVRNNSFSDKIIMKTQDCYYKSVKIDWDVLPASDFTSSL